MRLFFRLAPLGIVAALAACTGDMSDVTSISRSSSIASFAAPPFRGDPIVFVHGCPLPEGLGSVTNYRTALIWRTMYDYFRDRGYPAPEWTDPDVIPTSTSSHPSSQPAADNYLNILVLSDTSGNCGSSVKHAGELHAYVLRVLAATGAPRVDIVANSLGGLAARWYLKPVVDSLDSTRFPTFGGARYVRDIVFLASPHHGTEVAIAGEPVALIPRSDSLNLIPTLRPPHYDGARELFPAYNCDPLLDAFQRHLNGCEGVDVVVSLVTGDDAVSEQEVRVSYLNIYHPDFDELVQPVESACLNQRFPNDCSDQTVNRPIQSPLPMPHGAIRTNLEAIAATFTHVTARSRGPKNK